MDKQFNDIDLIERLLEGSLNEMARDVFNERIKTDAAFSDAFEQRKLLQASYIEASKRHELKKHVRSVVTDVKRKNANLRKVWLVAASFVILVGIGSFFLLHSRQPPDNSMAKQENNVVIGRKNQIEEYGTVDTLSNQPKSNAVTFLPVDGTVFYQKDTILFFLPVMDEKDVLIINDKSGSIIKKITLLPHSAEYKLLPYILKPGEYTWGHSFDESVKHSFSIK